MMKTYRYLPLVIAGLSMGGAAAHAQTLDLGGLYASYNQVELLKGQPMGGTASVALATNVYYNSSNSLYTYQYNVTNLGDPNGVSALSVSVSSAADYSTTGVGFFFGGAVDPTTDQVTYADFDSAGNAEGLGNTTTNHNNATAVYNTDPLTALGYISALNAGGDVSFQTSGTPESINISATNFDQFGDYFYVQSASAPGDVGVNISDDYSADFSGPGPQTATVPEAGSLSLVGCGLVGLFGLTFIRKARRQAACSF